MQRSARFVIEERYQIVEWLYRIRKQNGNHYGFLQPDFICIIFGKMIPSIPTTKRYVVSHFSKTHLNNYGLEQLNLFFKKNNIDSNNITLYTVEEANLILEPSTAELLQDHLGDLMRYIWNGGDDSDEDDCLDLDKDFPVIKDNEYINDETDTMIQINDYDINQFCHMYSLSKTIQDELQEIIDDAYEGSGSTDAIYLERNPWDLKDEQEQEQNNNNNDNDNDIHKKIQR
jgi:hypothetical protein